MNTVIVAVSRNGCPLESMVPQLAEHGYTWIPSEPGTPAMAAIGQYVPDLVIVESGTDPDAQVLACVRRIKEQFLLVPVFLIARKSSENLAIGALKAGIDDYFKPPFRADELIAAIDRKLFYSIDRKETDPISECFSSKLVGNSQIMQDLKKHIARVAKSESTVFITGETGTGKELAAELIHFNSARASKSLVRVNCAALPESLVESEFFGYERGAFTGAYAKTRGRFEQAQDGTVFLDEIGDMTPFAQSKILRVIEDKQISPLGGSATMPLNLRFIAATNQEPEEIMEKGTFRKDLFYRLNVARVHMPSLRKHLEDMPLMVNHFIHRLNVKFNRNIHGLKKEVLDLLYRYDWPGNVRELINVLEGAFINLPNKKIGNGDLPLYFTDKRLACNHLRSEERKHILAVLLENDWNKTTAAKKLNWSRMTLYRKMSRYHIVEKRSRRTEKVE